MDTDMEVPRHHALSATQIDDIATDLLVDKTFTTFRCRKFNSSLPQHEKSVEKPGLLAFVQRFVERPEQLSRIVRELCEAYGFDGSRELRESLCRYMNMYHPQHCGWEIVPTRAYGQDSAEGAVRARRHFVPGDRVRYLIGTTADLSRRELTDPAFSSHLSIVEQVTRSSMPQVLTGPLRFVNHHCRPNARFDAVGSSFVHVVATRTIELGEEITVSYGLHYFGVDNADCKCSHCRSKVSNCKRDSTAATNSAQTDKRKSTHFQNNAKINTHLNSTMLTDTQQVEHRHQRIYNLNWPKTLKHSVHLKALRSSHTTEFAILRMGKSPSKTRDNVAAARASQIRQNIASTPAPASHLQERLSGHITCGVCCMTILNTTTSIDQHRSVQHPVLEGLKGEQEWCGECEVYHARAQRSRHYANKHKGKPVLPAHKAKVINPVTLQPVARKRMLGKRSKYYEPSATEPCVSDPEDEGGQPALEPTILQCTPSPMGIPHPTFVAPSATGLHNPEHPEERDWFEQFQEVHRTQVATADLRIREQFTTHMERLKTRRKRKQKNPKTMMSSDFAAFVKVWDGRQEARQITADEYTDLHQRGLLTPSENRYVFVVCTMQDARRVLKLGAPLRYILVPRGEQALATMSRESYLAELRSKSSIDVQNMNEPISRTNRKPLAMTGEQAVNLFELDACINLLNLGSSRDRPYPPCIEDLAAYDLLARLKDCNVAGKQTIAKINDLSSCATFQVCARRGCLSGAHQDHFGLITTLTVDWGTKIWAVWPQMSEEEREEWAAAGEAQYPTMPCFPIILNAGDTLIQPSRAVHAPWTQEDCLISGTQHFHSPSMHHHIAAANFERRNPHTTNEEEPQEAVVKFYGILRQMVKGNPRWPWPSAANTEAYRQGVREFAVGFEYALYCDCEKGQCVNYEYCTCRMMGLGCNRLCHAAEREKAKNQNLKADRVEKDTNTGLAEVCDNEEWFAALLE